jgi:hypothetical protein
MARRSNLWIGVGLVVLLIVGLVARSAFQRLEAAQSSAPQMPLYEVDPMWPKSLPNHWLFGSVVGVSVDAQDHIWVIHRVGTLLPTELRGGKAAPPVIEFDQQGNVVQAWGGPGQGYEWPDSEHGIQVDYKGNIWVGGNGNKDAQILKFSKDGKFLLQIGHKGQNKGSNDTQNLGGPANFVIDRATNEIFVADGYVNHRVIVFDADTGAYKRHWGAYGKRPDDSYFAAPLGDTDRAEGAAPAAPRDNDQESVNDPRRYQPNQPQPQFRTVHSINISRDGIVYVADRVNDRVQLFQKDGTFIREQFIGKETVGGSGSVWDVTFSNDAAQRFLIVPDGTNEIVWQLLRQELKVLGYWGSAGHRAGEFFGIHAVAMDSKGTLFTTETYEGKRIQRFVNKGLGPVNGEPVLFQTTDPRARR